MKKRFALKLAHHVFGVAATAMVVIPALKWLGATWEFVAWLAVWFALDMASWTAEVIFDEFKRRGIDA